MLYEVTFADGSKLRLTALTEWDASFRARVMAWVASGQWWQVVSVRGI
jgi:hypothetical protein